MTTSPTAPGLEFRDIDALHPHEQVKGKKASHLARYMAKTRILPKLILIDAVTGVILDGHHRYWACRELGCVRVACCAVDYLHDSSITVVPRKEGQLVTKEEVIRRGLAGDPYPPKSTKHVHAIREMDQSFPLQKLL